MTERVRLGIRTAQVGLLVNTVLAAVKILAGVFGRSYALIADGVESIADIFSSLIVWGGLRIASRSADDDYPFGYGKAEPIAAAAVALLLLAAAIGIAIESVREIVTPHHTPRPFTLVVLVGVVLVKEILFRRVVRVGSDVGSTAVRADAFHHRSDAITSAAAFVGISVALIGGPGLGVGGRLGRPGRGRHHRLQRHRRAATGHPRPHGPRAGGGHAGHGSRPRRAASPACARSRSSRCGRWGWGTTWTCTYRPIPRCRSMTRMC